MKNQKILVLFLFCLLPFSELIAQSTGQALPAWFFKPENYNRNNLAVGISDPNPDTALSVEQAKINALINYTILHDAKFTSLNNVGIGTQQDDDKKPASLEYIIYTSIIKGKLPSLASVKVKEKFFTTFKEAVVLLEIDHDIPVDSSVLQFTLTRRAGFQRESNSLPVFADELDIEVVSKDSLVLLSNLVRDKAKYTNEKTASKCKFFSNYYEGRMLYYQGTTIEKKNASMPSPLNYGLWKSYIFNLVDQISAFNSLDINCQYKLSTTNMGNINRMDQSLNFQQLVYSLKNVQSQKLNTSIKNIGINSNHLFLEIKSPASDYKTLPIFVPGKNEKKQIKKYIDDKWISFGENGFETTWAQAMNLKKNNDQYLSTEVEIQAYSIHSGTIEGIQLAKLQLSSQLATKINALGKTDVAKDNQLTIKSAKLINVEKTGAIGPFFIFYQNPSPNIYNIRMYLFYDLKQINDL